MPNFQDIMSRVQTGLLGPSTNYGGIIDANDEDQARRQAQMAMYAHLLQAGGYSPQRTTLGQAIGGAMQAGQQAQSEGLKSALNAQLLKSQMVRNQRADTPDSVQQYEYAKTNGYTGSFEDWKKVTQQKALGPASIQEYNLYKDQTESSGGQAEPFEDWVKRRAQMGVGAVYTPGEAGGRKGTYDRVTGAFIPASSVNEEATAAATVGGAEASAKETGRGSATRVQTQIDNGLQAADAISTVKRGRQLLESIQTGGLDSAKLAITQMFGVTGADESELSANLGKAVLSQLRSTFGAQFTAQEGERLSSIEAGFGKSTEGNKRLLQQAEAILDRAARRGLRAAQDSGDSFSADEITKSMNFSLDPNAPQMAPAAPSHRAITPTSGGKTETAKERAKRLGL